MKEKPILFSGPMVLRLLAEIAEPGTGKTQTRRMVKWKYGPNGTPETPIESVDMFADIVQGIAENLSGDPVPFCDAKAKCVPGDRLWVKETWGKSSAFRGSGVVVYRADDTARFALAEDGGEEDWCELRGNADRSRCHPVERWLPSIHMPRWASRITLLVESVRVERLQDISEDDAVAEGMKPRPQEPYDCFDDPREQFSYLWESINGPGSWSLNPWVWVYTFKPEVRK